MNAQTAGATQGNKTGSHNDLRDLLLWLALLPFVLGFLLCFGQLALLLAPQYDSVDTRSLLKANYLPWPYDQIAPVNVEAFVKDVQQEQRRFGTPEAVEPTVIHGVFWVPPTPTAVSIAQATPEPQQTTPAPTNTPVAQRTATRTRTPASATATSLATSTALPSITPSSIPTRTATLVPPQSATSTLTQPPPATITFTPTARATRTATSPAINTPTSTRTTAPTPIPTATVPAVPTNPPPPSPTPYAPVRPIAENDGVADAVAPGTCRAYFGYRNDNSYGVTIQVGASNRLSEDIVPPPQTTVFEVGRIFSSFSVDWTSGQPLTWTLEGRIATAFWCNPQ